MTNSFIPAGGPSPAPGGIAGAGSGLGGSTGPSDPFSGYTVATIGGNEVMYVAHARQVAHIVALQARCEMVRLMRRAMAGSALIGSAN